MKIKLSSTLVALLVAQTCHADALDALFAPTTASPAAEADKPFSLDGELGIILTTGNTETSSIKGRLNAHQELESWSNDYVFEGFYKEDEAEGEDESRTTAQKLFMSGQGNYKLENPDHRIFAFGSYEDDRFSGFKYQSTVAAGWAHELWKDDESSFNYSIGPGYSYAVKDNENEEKINGMIVRGALDYQWRISDTAKFRQLLSTEVGSDNTKSKSETSLSAQINDAMALKVSLILNHNTDVEPETDNLDTETAVTIVYSFF